jgi:hypothetical protein
MGCTYANACNFESTATQDDGSCDFVSCEIVGCTYPNALNFDPSATVDDGNCLFTEGNGTCTTDINSDGIVTVADLLLLLTDFGGLCPD